MNNKVLIAECFKGYHLYQQRNEWRNWDGETDLVNRTFKRVFLDLNAATDFSEKKRNRGTKFHISEIPIIIVKSKTTWLLITELFSTNPLSGVAETVSSLTKGITMSQLEDVLPRRKWLVCEELISRTLPSNTVDIFYNRESFPGRPKCGLAWTVTRSETNSKSTVKLTKAINKLVIIET